MYLFSQFNMDGTEVLNIFYYNRVSYIKWLIMWPKKQIQIPHTDFHRNHIEKTFKWYITQREIII